MYCLWEYLFGLCLNKIAGILASQILYKVNYGMSLLYVDGIYENCFVKLFRGMRLNFTMLVDFDSWFMTKMLCIIEIPNMLL